MSDWVSLWSSAVGHGPGYPGGEADMGSRYAGWTKGTHPPCPEDGALRGGEGDKVNPMLGDILKEKI